MSKRIAILGAGPGGYVAAVRAAQLGAQVTVVENIAVGGTCLNRGCIPSKVMKTTADLMDRFRHADTFGIAVDGSVAPDMERLAARKAQVIQTQAKGIQALLAHHGVTWMQGRGRIAAHGRLQVDAADGSRSEVPWDDLIVATGSKPQNIPAFAFDGRKILSSDEALALTELPETMVIVGGGVIGCEFAGIFSALGVRITLVEALDRLLPLPSVDAACSAVLLREMKKRKIAVHLNGSVTSVAPDGDRLAVAIGPSPLADAKKVRPPLTVTADRVLVCIGRTPNTADIGLGAVGVDLDSRGWINADSTFATTADHVYAIGDVLGPSRIMLAHVASAEGIAAAERIMGGDRRIDYAAVPGAIFTIPEVACVGLTEAAAVDQGFSVGAESVLFRTLGKAQAMGELAGEAKIVFDTDSGRVLGVHLIGAHATDLIAEGGLAVGTGRTVTEIADTIHAHPTLGEAMMEAAFKATGRALHG